jgi:serine/threonine-protein kinase OSR1/STK39
MTTTEAPPSEWPADPAAYQLLGKIGQGAFASVWKATTVTADHRDCAVKVLNLDHVDTNLAEIRLEVQAMRLSSHPNVLACHTAFVKDRDLWLVTHLMRKGSSLHCLQEARRTLGPLQLPMEHHITYILHETLLGLQYLHNNGQIHRDVKAGNILLDGNGDVRIADFGVSGWLVQGGSQQEKAKTFVGTPCWMAPEVMEQIHGYDTKADVWSLGITAMELAKGYAPYAKYPPMKVLILTIQEDPPSLDTYEDDDDDSGGGASTEEWTKAFRTIISVCLQRNPSKRPSCGELLQKHFAEFGREEYRQERRDRMRTEICDLVQDVGTNDRGEVAPSSRRQLPATMAPISIVTEEPHRPAGTTWIFTADDDDDDHGGSQQVLAPTATKEHDTMDDVLNDLDEFERQTGGENYARGHSGTEAPITITAKQKDEPDDLEDFMDEFEKTTAGENFRVSK